MKKVILLCFLLVSISACGESASNNGEVGTNNGTISNNGTATNNGGASNNGGLDGEALYNANCKVCHGEKGVGTPIWEASVAGYEPIDDIVNVGRGTMAPITLKMEEVGAIQVYLLSLAPSLSELTGPEVYTRLCQTCHGEKGQGAALGMQLRYDDLEFSRYWIREGRGKTLDYTSDMPAYPESMISNQQIDEMFAEIDAVPHPTADADLFTQYCSNCHGATGRGGPSGEGIRGGDEYREKIRRGKNWSKKQYWKRGKYMSKWNASQISDSEMGQIRAHGRTL